MVPLRSRPGQSQRGLPTGSAAAIGAAGAARRCPVLGLEARPAARAALLGLGLLDRRQRLRRWRQGPALPRFEEPVEIDQIIPHRAVLTRADLDEGYPEVPQPSIAAQCVHAEPQPARGNVLIDRHGNWLGTERNWPGTLPRLRHRSPSSRIVVGQDYSAIGKVNGMVRLHPARAHAPTPRQDPCETSLRQASTYPSLSGPAPKRSGDGRHSPPPRLSAQGVRGDIAEQIVVTLTPICELEMTGRNRNRSGEKAGRARSLGALRCRPGRATRRKAQRQCRNSLIGASAAGCAKGARLWTSARLGVGCDKLSSVNWGTQFRPTVEEAPLLILQPIGLCQK